MQVNDFSSDGMKKVVMGAIGMLQSLKIQEVDLILQVPLTSEQIGVFEGVFHDCNGQQSHRLASAQNFPKNPTDPRTVRVRKNVETWRIHSETSFRSSYDYQFQMAMTEAKALSCSLACTRGTEANPEYMERHLKKIVKGQSAVKEVKIIRGNDLLKHGMNLHHAVGRAATSQPRAIFVRYMGRPGDKTIDLALVGKGVTYDTGGLNIKMALMEKMHGDKGGATAVMGALQGCLKMKVKKNIIFCCAVAENAIGNNSYKPSDILRAKNGLSVEIGNTDAEGRLVMSDCMTFAQRAYKPKKVCYIATLTGAIMVGLGVKTAGFFTHDEEMQKGLQAASKFSAEPIWHMPLTDEHREAMVGLRGTDLCNLGKSRWGGSCTAAAFLERFVEDKRPWAHIDIAGPGCLMDNDQSGFGAKLLLAYIANNL